MTERFTIRERKRERGGEELKCRRVDNLRRIRITILKNERRGKKIDKLRKKNQEQQTFFITVAINFHGDGKTPSQELQFVWAPVTVVAATVQPQYSHSVRLGRVCFESIRKPKCFG